MSRKEELFSILTNLNTTIKNPWRVDEVSGKIVKNCISNTLSFDYSKLNLNLIISETIYAWRWKKYTLDQAYVCFERTLIANVADEDLCEYLEKLEIIAPEIIESKADSSNVDPSKFGDLNKLLGELRFNILQSSRDKKAH